MTCNCPKQFIKYQANQRCLLGSPWFTGAGEREAGPSEPGGPQDFGIYLSYPISIGRGGGRLRPPTKVLLAPPPLDCKTFLRPWRRRAEVDVIDLLLKLLSAYVNNIMNPSLFQEKTSPLSLNFIKRQFEL